MWTHPTVTSRWNHCVRIKENVCCVECLKKHKLTFADFLQMLVLQGGDLKQKNILIISIYSR